MVDPSRLEDVVVVVFVFPPARAAFLARFNLALFSFGLLEVSGSDVVADWEGDGERLRFERAEGRVVDGFDLFGSRRCVAVLRGA